MYCIQTYLTSSKRHSDLADDDLVQQGQSGDQDAFEMLVDRYSNLLFLQRQTSMPVYEPLNGSRTSEPSLPR